MPKSSRTKEPLQSPAALMPEESDFDELRGLFADLKNRRQRALLAGFIVGKGLKRAAELAGLSRWCHYQWMRDDALYRERFKLARRILIDDAEGEAYRRAVHGVDVPIVHRGEVTGAAKSRSDQLLMFVLKAMRPEIYRDGAEPEPDFDAPRLTITVEKPEAASGEPRAVSGAEESPPRGRGDAEARGEETSAAESAATEYEERALNGVRGKL
jgi:hypothetical protein